MPIDLTSKFNTNKKFTPGYFSRHFTGKGGAVGLFNETNASVLNNIKNYYEQKTTDAINFHFDTNNKALVFDSRATPTAPSGTVIKTQHNYELSPLAVLNNNLVFYPNTRFYELPNFLKQSLDTELDTLPDGSKVKMGLVAKSIHQYNLTDAKDTNVNMTSFVIHSALTLGIQRPNQTITKVKYFNNLNAEPVNIQELSQTHNQVYILDDIDLYKASDYMNALHNKLNPLLEQLNQKLNINLSESQIFDKLIQYNFADLLSNQAKLNHDHLFNDLAKLFRFNMYAKPVDRRFNLNHHKLDHQILSQSYNLMKLEEKTQSDANYQHFYNQIKFQTIKHPSYKSNNKYETFDFNQLISINTRLSLTHQIEQLSQNKNVHQFKPTTKQLVTNEKYSVEQLNVIHTTNPYSIVIAGAGSGKSHTLLGRLRFLQQNQVDLKKVLVTSFTNTAAQNIINRFHGGINSLTNANLFHKIYQENFPTHDLTNDDTIVNMLNMLSDNSKLMQSSPTMQNTKLELIAYIKASLTTGFKKVDIRQVTEKLIDVVNQNLDDVLTILDAINQTSLLLEPIIINALMQTNRTIKYPDSLKNLEFIITDESQDTSTFEYILLLQLATINQSQLMIIGDSNQTLYEFRNANPEFLNALETSDIFKCYTMSTNYRSQQSILNVTNQFLDVLKTNDHAKLQLHSNQYSNLTLDEFKDDVQISNVLFESKRKNDNNTQSELASSVYNRSDIRDWVLNQYNQGHQIAIMAYRNKDAQDIGTAITQIINQSTQKKIKVGYTRMPQNKPNTWLSDMLGKTKDIDFENNAQKTHQITKQALFESFNARLTSIANKKHFQPGIINPWALETIKSLLNRPAFNANLRDFNQQKISFNRFMGFISLWLIKAETTKNNVARVMQSQNQPDWHDCDIVVSTIHSAKGLEFDAVVCYFDENQKSATSQENLRLYGVALTRAKQNELIINRSKRKKHSNLPTNFGYEESDMFQTPMRTAYARVMQNLKKQQPNP